MNLRDDTCNPNIFNDEHILGEEVEIPRVNQSQLLHTNKNLI